MSDSHGRCGHCQRYVVTGMECVDPECPFANLAKESEPQQYALLRHAAQLARQLEAAGVPEGRVDQWGVEVKKWVMPVTCQRIVWENERIVCSMAVYPTGIVLWQYSRSARASDGSLCGGGEQRVSDPLPPALINAIREAA